jgi:DNA-binding NarL/FixJ family response regulator
MRIPPAIGAASLRVLIVEDQHDLAEALRVNLRGQGYRVDTASDGRQALAFVRAQVPDIMILDLGLPGLDGLSLLARLRSEQHWFPVLILSARDEDADKLEGFRLGADDYVTKPFRSLELMARIQAMARRVVQTAAAVAASAAAAEAPTSDMAPVTFDDATVALTCGLTARQAEVARLMAEGLTNPEIAEALQLSRFTVRNHAEQIFARLGVASRWQVADALRAAVRRHRATQSAAPG